MAITEKKISKHINAGRTAIKFCMLGVVMRSNEDGFDDIEMAALSDLLKQYNELISPYAMPSIVKTSAANHNQGE